MELYLENEKQETKRKFLLQLKQNPGEIKKDA